jgi:pimeloyl-ACP methyl ester carboxylesterase
MVGGRRQGSSGVGSVAAGQSDRERQLGGREQVRTGEGRVVEVVGYGQEDGEPVFFLHGTPGSGVGLDMLEGPAQQQGVCLLAPHRPGVGRSDGPSTASLLDYADHLAGLADALGLERFGVVGYSSGGPYALACGARLGHRVTSVATIGGVAPLVTDELRATVHGHEDQLLTSLERGEPQAAEAQLQQLLSFVQEFPDEAEAAMREAVDASDRRALDEIGGADDNQAPAFEQGVAAAVNDYRLWAAPWGFDLADVQVKVDLWQGADDRLVPPSHARALHDALPAARLHLLEDTGHISVLFRFDQVLKALSNSRHWTQRSAHGG